MDVTFKQPILNKKPLEEMLESIAIICDYIGKYGAASIPDKALVDFRTAIKDLFPDYKPNIVYLSDNLDKEFFGLFIKRKMNAKTIFIDDVREINTNYINDYSIDIDSKLFSIGLSPMEIVTLIIYDMYCILSNNAVLDFIAAVDAICAGKSIAVCKEINEYLPIAKLFEFCSSDYLYRKLSIFTHDENELIRIPDLLSAYEIDNIFIEGANKLFKTSNMTGRTFPHPALSLNWAISIAHNYEPRSTDALAVINDFIATTGSSLIKNSALSIAKQMLDINIKAQNKAALKESSLFTNIRKNGMKSLENDLFEYEMRVKNIDDENSAIFLMRQINSRIGIISDYLDNEKISEAEMKRWQTLYDRYDKLRIKMTNKPIYSKKMYGLFVDYNALMSQSPENMMTMNTMY